MRAPERGMTRRRMRMRPRREYRRPARDAATYRSDDRGRFANAVEQRGAHEIRTRQLRIARGAFEVLVVRLAHRRILLRKHALVALRLRFRVVHSDVPPLPRIAVQHLEAALARENRCQLLAEIDRVV